MVDPATATLIATAISSAAKGGSSWLGGQKEKKASKMRSKEMKRATIANLLNDTLNRQAELEGLNLESKRRLGQRGAQSLMDTAATMREAFRI